MSSKSIAFVIAVVVFVIFRSFELGSLPVFLDEGIRGSVALDDEKSAFEKFVACSQVGKPTIGLLLSLFSRLPVPTLVGFRLMSVFFGTLTVLALFHLGVGLATVYDIRRPLGMGLWMSGLYALSPMAHFFDRLAVPDSATYCGSAVLALVSLKFGRVKPGVRGVVWISAAMGALLLVRLCNFLYFPLPFLLLLSFPDGPWRGKHLWALFGTMLVLCLAVFLGLDQIGAFPESELDSKLSFRWDKLDDAGKWLWATYGTLHSAPVAALLLFSPWVALAAAPRRAFPWCVLALICILVQALAMKHWMIRYHFGWALPYFVCAGTVLHVLWVKLWNGSSSAWILRGAALMAVLLIAVDGVGRCLRISTRPENAELPGVMRHQYVYSWPSGFALESAMDFLQERQQKRGRPFHVFMVRPDPGVLGMTLYAEDDDGMSVSEYHPDVHRACVAAGKDVYLVQSSKYGKPAGQLPWKKVRVFPFRDERYEIRLLEAVLLD